MALDMLARRENMEQIAEILLSQGQVIEAMRCMSKEPLDRIHCFKLLDAAWKTENRQIKYTVYSHLATIRKVPYFESNCEEFDKFSKEFKILFNKDEIAEAEVRFSMARISESTNRDSISESTFLDDSSCTMSLNSSIDDEQQGINFLAKKEVIHDLKKNPELKA